MKWKRLGKCKKCGKCCSQLRMFIPTKNMSPDMYEFYKTRGFEVKMSECIPAFYIELPIKCPHLSDENLCKLQGIKPKECSLAPQAPYQSEGIDCGYMWVKR